MNVLPSILMQFEIKRDLSKISCDDNKKLSDLDEDVRVLSRILLGPFLQSCVLCMLVGKKLKINCRLYCTTSHCHPHLSLSWVSCIVA
jgi:hypothetical protein